MSKITCAEKGYHSYSEWRTINDSRMNSDIRGMNSGVEHFVYYVRNCQHCEAVQAASSDAEKAFKTREARRAKKLVLTKK